jgi:gliding motility-associated-like protein
MSDTSAYDANTGYALRKIPSGYPYSARLGDEILSSDSNPRAWEQSLQYTMTVDSSNALLVMKFACVLQYASDHTAKMEPRFRVTLFDSNGDTIPDCSNYDVYASNGNVEGFNTYTPTSSVPGKNEPIKWRDWTTVGANLLNYLGKTITIEFMTADCTGKYHFGYAYFVAESHPMYITVNYCAGDAVAKLTAPEGFNSYSWKDNNGNVIDTAQILVLSAPKEGDTYSCTMVSATGCTITLQSTIAKYVINSDFSSYMLDCVSNTVQFTNQSSTSHGELEYQWDFGDSVTSSQQNPQHTFSTSGMHTTTLILTNPPSTCTDTLTKVVESFSPPLVGIDGDSTYCPNETYYLKAHGAYKYIWNTGVTADSIEVGAPGGTYWMIGYSSTGCVSDTNYLMVTEEPDWVFVSESDTSFCEKSNSTLLVSGAVNYLWNTGDTTNSIVVTTPGTYQVTGANKRGCKKNFTYHVVEYQLPDVDFTYSPSVLNTKHNLLACSVPDVATTSYAWTLGDGLSASGASVEHVYSISPEISSYTISLKATTEHDCVDSTSKTIDVVPFVPNVFSPNGDGINDVFMAGYSLQIFDRNGLELYNGTNGWEGKYNGEKLNPDTYFYVVQYTNKNGDVKTLKGYITLVK